MKERIDIVVDLETLGLGDNAPIIQIAAVVFNIWTGDIIEEFNVHVKLPDDFRIQTNTLKWWLSTDPSLLKSILDQGEFDLSQTLVSFQYLIYKYGEVYLWGNGSNFDNRILKHQMESEGITYPIEYYNDRDMRTLMDVVEPGMKNSDFAKKYGIKLPETKHDALSDCRYEAELITCAWKFIERR